MLKHENKHKSGGNAKKDGELFVFGYASKLFRDDKAADFHDKEKHLISWQGDSSLQIDRYDCRLLFTDKSQFDFDPANFSYALSLQEDEIEELCDEERYLELTTNMEEYDIEQEEEMKRFKEAISQDSGYAAVGFSYDDNDSNNSVDATEQLDNQVHGPAPQPVEKFVAPDELGVPDGMEIPDTAKMNAIIEKTAMFVSEQGAQMEILVKAKQAGNPQFDFLNFDNWLNPYYKHVLKSIKDETYIPQMVQSPKPEEEMDSEPESGEDDSDGEFELHPLLTASHRSASNTPNSSLPSSPVPQSTEEHTSYHLTTVSREGEHSMYEQSNGDDGHHDVYHWTGHSYDNNYYGGDYPVVPISSHYMPTQSTTTLTAASLLPPPPPPPGEGPLEDEWLGNTSRPTQPNSIIHPTGVPGIIQGHPLIVPSTLPIVPPPPDVQPVIDKLANYVAKNGHDFENIIKAKNDPRFTFVHTWHEHHRYYIHKKQLCVDELERERKAALAKGPISFSIKPKEVQKPKIEYRTNVIYKQSIDPEESEDEETKQNEMEENGNENGNGGNGTVSRDAEKDDKFQEETTEKDVEEQMRSIQAAEKEAQRLEAESQVQREKQLQEERRRKASLFISMLKKTKVSEGTPQNSDQPNTQPNSQAKRRFTERKRSSDISVDMFEDKRPRNDEVIATSGAGAPTADIIRITQDLMAKVRAASTKR